ncbi:MAG: 50S ribosomal protein L25 [Chloroflexota bacterium]
MPDRPALAATRRTETGKKVSRLRSAGRLPGVVYGHGVTSENVSLDAHEFELFRRQTGASTLVDLRVEGGRARPVLIHGVQIHPVTRRPLHVDLFAVRMTEEITLDVRLAPTGVAPAVDSEGGTLIHALESIRIRALPGNLPQSIEYDVSPLTSFEAMIHVRDLQIPADIALLTDPDEVVARVLPPRVEAEAEAAPAAAEEEGAGAPAGAEETAEEG